MEGNELIARAIAEKLIYQSRWNMDVKLALPMDGKNKGLSNLVTIIDMAGADKVEADEWLERIRQSVSSTILSVLQNLDVN